MTRSSAAPALHSLDPFPMKRFARVISSPVRIRPAVETDLVGINDIYNYYVLNSTCTYQEEQLTMIVIPPAFNAAT